MFNSNPRKLVFPLKEDQPQDGSGATEPIPLQNVQALFPTDSDEQIEIVIKLSLNEYTAIAEAVDVGRDIAFSDRSNYLWYTWQKIVQGVASVNCDDVADCVESELTTNQDLVNSVTTTVNNNGFGDPNRINENSTTIPTRQSASFNDTEVAELSSCDLDRLWGGIRHGIVQRLDDAARDLLEDLANINDVVQRYQAFIDVIPVLGDVAEAAVTFATEVIPDILNGYNAHSSEEQLDTIACDLFGLVCSECRYPTFKEVADYYATGGYDIDNLDAVSMLSMVGKLSGMITGALPPDIIYNTTITFQLLVLYLGATFNGQSGAATLGKYARLGEDFGSDNWIDACETCDETYLVWSWDFTAQGKGQWQIDTAQNPTQGAWDGDAFKTTPAAVGATLAVIHPQAASARPVAVKLEWDLVSGTPTAFNRFFRFRPTPFSTTGEATVSLSTCTNTTHTGASGNDTTINQRNMQQIQIRITTEPSTVVYKLRKITIVYERAYPIDSIDLSFASTKEICT